MHVSILSLVLCGIAMLAVIALAAVVDSCSLSQLRSDSKCFDSLSATEKRRLQVYLLAKALNAAGGGDYTNFGTLMKSVACWKGESDFILDSFVTQIATRLASGEGAATPATIADARAAIKCMGGADSKAVRCAIVFLLCKLTAKIAPPIV